MIGYKVMASWLQRMLQHPSTQPLILLAVAVVGVAMDHSLRDLDTTLAKQTQLVEQLKVDLQVFKASSSAVTDRLTGRMDLVEQRVQDMDARLRRREHEFEENLSRQRRAMDVWERAHDESQRERLRRR